MHNLERHIYPIDRAYTDRIDIHIPLPTWVDTDHIGVDLYKMTGLLNVGGIQSLRITVQESSEKSKAIPVATSVNPDGSSTAGMSSVSTRVDEFETSLDPYSNQPFIRNAVWAQGNIAINMDEVKQKVLESPQNIREADSWVSHLNRVITGGIRKIATHHLLQSHDIKQKIMVFCVCGDGIILDSLGIGLSKFLSNKINPHFPKVEEVVANAVWEFCFWSLWSTFFYGFENNGKGYRLSLIPGYELDRALAIQLLTRTMPLVKSIPKTTS